MSEQLLPIEDLIKSVLSKLEELNYAWQVVRDYRRCYNRLLRFALRYGYAFYSEDLARKFLLETYKHKLDNNHYSSAGDYVKYRVRMIRVLGDFQLHGIILRRRLGRLASTPIPAQFLSGYQSFIEECKRRNYSEQGTYTRTNRIKNFLLYLDDQNIQSFNDLSANILSAYVSTYVNLSSKSVKANLTSQRVFLRHLYLNGFTNDNYSDKLPKLKSYYEPGIPKTWTADNVKTVLESIDRGNPTGKRDYAILLIITRLGLRASDIKMIKLEHLRWDTNTIEIVQSKTGRSITLPILKDIGWALIDYLKNGRPITDAPYVFVRHNAPFEAFAPNSAMNRILVNYIRKAGIKIPRNVPLGLHSLRHTLASTLLAQDTPLPVISEILGHMNVKSTDIYLHIDYKRLQECAINPEEVFHDVR